MPKKQQIISRIFTKNNISPWDRSTNKSVLCRSAHSI